MGRRTEPDEWTAGSADGQADVSRDWERVGAQGPTTRGVGGGGGEEAGRRDESLRPTAEEMERRRDRFRKKLDRRRRWRERRRDRLNEERLD